MVDENFEFERKAKGYCLDLTNNVVTDATLEYKKKKKKTGSVRVKYQQISHFEEFNLLRRVSDSKVESDFVLCEVTKMSTRNV